MQRYSIFLTVALIVAAVFIYVRECTPKPASDTSEEVKALREQLAKDSARLYELEKTARLKDSAAKAQRDSAVKIAEVLGAEVVKSKTAIQRLTAENRRLEAEKDTAGFYDNTRQLRALVDSQQTVIEETAQAWQDAYEARINYDRERDSLLSLKDIQLNYWREKAGTFSVLYDAAQYENATTAKNKKSFLNRIYLGAGGGAGFVTSPPGSGRSGTFGGAIILGIFYKF